MRFICSKCNGIIEVENSERGNPVGCGHCGKFVVVPEDRIATNIVLNNDFVLKEKLGQGGVGTVYRADQISLDRPVALKILMEQFAQDKNFIEDFIREARAAARLNHPNIVQSFAVGQDNGVFFCAMELVEGETLKQIISREGKTTLEFSLTIMRQMAEALDFAWKNQKLVHRDIKPDNIMLASGGIAKLADLGLARVATDVEEESDDIMGTPQYISPEQLIGSKTDVRTDIYSLGATWYHAITGQFPFDGDSPQEIARKHLEEVLVPPDQVNPDIPKTISVMISKMMAKHPDDRYRDAEELIQDLKLVANDPNSRKSGAKGRKGTSKTFTTSIKRPGTSTGKISTRTGNIKLNSGANTTSRKITINTTSRKMTKNNSNTSKLKLETTATGATKLTSATGATKLSPEKTVMMDPNHLDATTAEAKSKNMMMPIIAILMIIVVVVILTFGSTKLEARAAEMVKTELVNEATAELAAAFEKKMIEEKVTVKDYKSILSQYGAFQSGVKDYHALFNTKVSALLDYSTEMEIRDLRKAIVKSSSNN